MGGLDYIYSAPLYIVSRRVASLVVLVEVRGAGLGLGMKPLPGDIPSGACLFHSYTQVRIFTGDDHEEEDIS